MRPRSMLTDYVPLFVMIAMALGLALSLLKLAVWLGPKRPRAIKSSAYESGMDPVGTARDRYSVKFYLVGMIFIIFDVEIVFMYPWAVSFRTFLANGGGLGSLAVISVFVVIMFVGLIYDIKKGGLDWD